MIVIRIMVIVIIVVIIIVVIIIVGHSHICMFMPAMASGHNFWLEVPFFSGDHHYPWLSRQGYGNQTLHGPS